MNKRMLIAVGLFAIGLAGCESNDVASTQPTTMASYTPTSGQNLAPGIAPYAHGDPEWPMDAGRGGGGGRGR